MAFIKDKQYWAWRIVNIQRAIDGTKIDLAKHLAAKNQRAIVAHKAQIKSYTDLLAIAKKEIKAEEGK